MRYEYNRNDEHSRYYQKQKIKSYGMRWCKLTRPDVPSGWFASRWVNKQINQMYKIKLDNGKINKIKKCNKQLKEHNFQKKKKIP